MVEFDNSYILIAGNISLLTEQKVRVATVLDLMRDVFNTLSKSEQKPQGKLSRLHLHTLAFQAIMTPLKGGPWGRSDVAATKAALTATRCVCFFFMWRPPRRRSLPPGVYCC